MGIKDGLSRRTAHNLLEEFKAERWIENIQPHKGVWAITPSGSSLIRAHNIWEELGNLMFQKKVPETLVGFEWTLDRQKILAAYICTKINEPEIISALYLMRRSMNSDMEFAMKIGQFIRLTLSLVPKIGTNPELAKGLEGILKNGEMMQSLANWFEVVQK